eukprot:351435-Prorocentrum_minimum.AAC.2
MTRSRMYERMKDTLRTARRTISRPSNLVLLLLALSMSGMHTSTRHREDSDSDTDLVSTNSLVSHMAHGFLALNACGDIVTSDNVPPSELGHSGRENKLHAGARIKDKRVEHLQSLLEGKHAVEYRKHQQRKATDQASLQAWAMNMQSAFEKEKEEPTSGSEDEFAHQGEGASKDESHPCCILMQNPAAVCTNK